MLIIVYLLAAAIVGFLIWKSIVNNRKHEREHPSPAYVPDQPPVTLAADERSSLGLKPNVAAMLSYVLVWIAGVASAAIVGQIVLARVQEQFAARIAAEQLNPADPQAVVWITLIISIPIALVITLLIGFVFFLIERNSRFVRLNAMQAVLFSIPWFAVTFATAAIGTHPLIGNGDANVRLVFGVPGRLDIARREISSGTLLPASAGWPHR